MMENISYQLIKIDKKEVYLPAGALCKFADIVITGEIIARMEGPSGKYMQITTRSPGELMNSAFIFGKNKTIPVNLVANKPTTILRMGTYADTSYRQREGGHLLVRAVETEEFR